MKRLLLLFSINFDLLCSSYLHYQYDDEETTKRLAPVMENIEFEPVNPIKNKEKVTVDDGIDCDNFPKYALNCTMESAIIYNSSKKSPPMPAKMMDWCSAIRHLTNCAIDWNSECKDVTESHFNEESIKGHMHVVNNICDDELFITRYDELPVCIDKASKAWEACYVIFKASVDYQKNRTKEWTHYETHFNLCCARTLFRRCTLTALFVQKSSKCSHNQAVVLQKFSVIVSEGDVFQFQPHPPDTSASVPHSPRKRPPDVVETIVGKIQLIYDCDHNMMYPNCPGGDPRPSANLLAMLTEPEKLSRAGPKLGGYRTSVVLIALLKLCL